MYYKFLYKDLTPFIERTGCWDYIKVINQVKLNQLAVVPIYNLVQNVGLEGTHTHKGKGQAFELSNHEELGQYVFVKEPQTVKPDIQFDLVESTDEGLRDKKKIWHRILQTYCFTDIQDLRNKLKIGTRIRRFFSKKGE